MCNYSVGDTCRKTQEGKEIKNEFINLTPSESMSLAFYVQISTVALWFVFSLKCISIFPEYLKNRYKYTHCFLQYGFSIYHI